MTATDHATTVAPPPDAFRFGRNWRRYISTYLDADRERVAAESLRDLVGDLDQKSFLDVGCGSGLFSMCAYRAGAVNVVSIDVDPDAVTATRELQTRADAPPNWRVLHQSILAPDILAELEPADVVYSWGVLHHTGDMYTAIRNAADLVKPEVALSSQSTIASQDAGLIRSAGGKSSEPITARRESFRWRWSSPSPSTWALRVLSAVRPPAHGG